MKLTKTLSTAALAAAMLLCPMGSQAAKPGDFTVGKGFYRGYGPKVAVDNSVKLRYYVRGERDAWLDAVTEHHWGAAAVTKAVPVFEMHRWLKNHPQAFIAALAE